MPRKIPSKNADDLMAEMSPVVTFCQGHCILARPLNPLELLRLNICGAQYPTPPPWEGVFAAMLTCI